MAKARPYTVPYGAPAYGPPPYHMQEGVILLVNYEVDAAAAAAAMSPPLTLNAGAGASVFIGDMLQLPHCGKFHEGGIVLTARHGAIEAPYTPYLWTSTDEAMMVGREVYGMPKVLCDDTPLRWSGNQVHGEIRRRGQPIMAMEVNIEDKIDPATVPLKKARLTVRVTPDPTGRTDGRREVLHLPLEGYRILEAWKGRAMVQMHATAFSRAHELRPASQDLTGFYLRVSWTLDRADILETI